MLRTRYRKGHATSWDPTADPTKDIKYLGLAGALKKRVFGQDHAVDAVSNAILRNRVGLSSPSRPIGSFLFLGSSGVGKTELAKALAKEHYGDEKRLMRWDMSEFSSRHSVSRKSESEPWKCHSVR